MLAAIFSVPPCVGRAIKVAFDQNHILHHCIGKMGLPRLGVHIAEGNGSSGAEVI
jgi:hypothetical protein